MHYQTRRDLWTRLTAVLRPAGDVAGRQRRLRIILVGAIGLALVFLYIPKPLSSFSFMSASESGGTVPVLVAKHYLSAFHVLKPEAVEMRRFPQSYVPPGALNSLAELENESGQSLYAAVVAIPEGQPLTRMVLIDAGQKQRMASLLRPGRVAVSFSVDKAHAAGGWVQPGDTIAVFETVPLVSRAGLESSKSTRVLFSALQVLAVDKVRLGQSAPEEKESEREAALLAEAAEEGSSRIITVLATSGEAAALLDARDKGSLSVVLRALGDDLPWPERS